MFWFKKKDESPAKIEKVSSVEIYKDNQENPDRIYDEKYGQPINVFSQPSSINSNLEVISGKGINEALILECINKIDSIYYQINLAIKDYIVNLILKHPELCYILYDKSTGNLVGYLYCFALTEIGTVNFLLGNETFETMSDEIFANPSTMEGLFNLNIAEFAMLPEYQTNENYHALFAALATSLAELTKRNCYVNYSFIEISNIFEREFAKAMNYETINDTKNNRKMAGNVFDYKHFQNIATYDKLKEAYETPEAEEFLKLQQNYNYLFTGKTGTL